jgi:hypothetical protein
LAGNRIVYLAGEKVTELAKDETKTGWRQDNIHVIG